MIEAGYDSCGNGCGMISALIGCICFGSFGAPLKSEAVNMVDPNPFVLQTYKSAMSFITCWLVLLLGVDFEFTPWGILSGLMWVSGGVCGIFGIRNAGLAISVGTWSSITVIVSFSWGIFAFSEEVQSIGGTIFGILLMLLGFSGMTYFSSINEGDISSLTEPLLTASSGEIFPCDGNNATSNNIVEESSDTTYETPNENESRTAIAIDEEDSVKIKFVGIEWNKKVLGILGAAVDGILGGSNLIPMKLAPSIDRGIDYVISFGIGAAIATCLGWLVYFLWNSYQKESYREGYEALPSMHLNKIMLQGALSGILWSIGNVSQILSVTFLGESIGMSIVQSQMIISGLLGILLFKEIKGRGNIVKWVLSALLTFVGIILLSQQHKI